MYGYATASYNQNLNHLNFWLAHTAVKSIALKVKKELRQSKMSWLMSEAIMNSPYSVVPRARHCGIPAILLPMSLKNAPSAGLRAQLEILLIIFRCFLLFQYLV